MAAGRLSYAKVRALTRLATPDTEAEWVEKAETLTAEELEQLSAAEALVLLAADSLAGRGPMGTAAPVAGA